MQHAYELDNRPFARIISAAMLTLAMWFALIPNPAAAAEIPELPPCGGMLFNIAIESTGSDRRIEDYKCTLEMRDGKPIFKFQGNALCGQNNQVAFSGESSLTVDVFHAHITCTPAYDPSAVFDGSSCADAHVVFIVNGRNADNVDLTCDFKSLGDPKVVLTQVDFAAICDAACEIEHFTSTSLGTNWYHNETCDGTFSVPETVTVDEAETQLDLVWFDKEGLASHIASGDENPTATGVCLAYLEPIITI